MNAERAFAAVDLGADSGRVVLGRLSDGAVSLEVVHRFPNRTVRLPDGLHWNLLGLFADTLEGLGHAAAKASLHGIGVDSWGCDYGLLDGSSRLLGLPYHYRDERTHGMVERVHGLVGRDEQRQRLQDRLDERDKLWKFDLADVQERSYWDGYRQAYEAALSICSTRPAA